MKANAREATAFFAKPHSKQPAVLLYGMDAMRVALRRKEVLEAWLGPKAAEDMRLMTVSAADLRKSPAILIDEMKSIGFFPGPRAVWVEGGGDGITAAVQEALKDWQSGDAQILVTAGQLAPSSKLRKFFEKSPLALCIAIYDDPPSLPEVQKILDEAGLERPTAPAMRDVMALAETLDPGDFRQFAIKLATYKINDPAPLSAADLEACAPSSQDADLDELIHIVAEGKAQSVGPLLGALRTQGISPVRIAMVLERHFRMLHSAASDPDGPAAGVSKLRPPVYGPRKARLTAQANAWRMHRAERALHDIMSLSLDLRSAGQTAPLAEQVERVIMRLAMTARR